MAQIPKNNIFTVLYKCIRYQSKSKNQNQIKSFSDSSFNEAVIDKNINVSQTCPKFHILTKIGLLEYRYWLPKCHVKILRDKKG